jgi:hypothetical protein
MRRSKGEVEMTDNQNAPVLNLRETRKQMAASKAAHPAGKQAPAKTAPAKQQPAKKVAAKATTKVRWTRLQYGTGAVEQDATFGGKTWQLRRKDNGWTVKQDGKLLTPKPVSYAEAGRVIVAAAKAVAA